MVRAIDLVAGRLAGKDAAERVAAQAQPAERVLSAADSGALRRADEKRQRRAARRLETTMTDDHERTDDERVRFTDLQVAPDGMGHEAPATGVPTHGIEAMPDGTEYELELGGES